MASPCELQDQRRLAMADATPFLCIGKGVSWTEDTTTSNGKETFPNKRSPFVLSSARIEPGGPSIDGTLPRVLLRPPFGSSRARISCSPLSLRLTLEFDPVRIFGVLIARDELGVRVGKVGLSGSAKGWSHVVVRPTEREDSTMAMAMRATLQAHVASRRHARRARGMSMVARPVPRSWMARASGEEGRNDSIAPVKLESPAGEFLTYMLQEEPELFDSAVEQQLEKLVKDKEDQEEKQEDDKGTSTDLVLYRRMGEVKAAERKAAVLDIMYACIVQNFVRIGVTLLPKLDGLVDASPVDLNALTQGVHTPEALEMVKDHLRNVLGGQQAYSNVMVKMSKLQAAQVYIASTMFGYFLRRVDKRFQLEKAMGTLPESREEAVARLERLFNQTLDVEEEGGGEPSGTGETHTTLRQYVESFDQQTLAETAQVVTQEAATITERQVGSVFGNLMELQMEMMKVVGEDAQSAEELMGRVQKAVEAGSVQSLSMTYGSLRRVVLEAVAFGSFLRDTESYVDSEYGLTPAGRFLGPGGPSSPPPPPAPTA